MTTWRAYSIEHDGSRRFLGDFDVPANERWVYARGRWGALCREHRLVIEREKQSEVLLQQQ